MEFEKTVLPCLKWASRDVLNQEQTAEVRLPEGMPDIGSILGAWGQCILRGKDWRSGEAGVSGGVMVWVMYLPAEGGEPQCVEGWLPIQHKWRVPDCQREGIIHTHWLLKNLDARTLSVRKLMIRGTVGILAEVLEPTDAELYTPSGLPEDVQLLQREYPVLLPREAGEKTFRVEEEISLPAGKPVPEQLLCCRLEVMAVEQKVTGGKAVFRGSVRCHILYRGEDGGMHTLEPEISFAQFEDLEHDYEPESQLSVLMDVTGFEPELQSGTLTVKADMTAQYVVLEQSMLKLVEDAYSPLRPVSVHTDTLEVPTVLDRSKRIMEPSVELPNGRVVDMVVYPEPPTVHRAGQLAEIVFPGSVQVLSYNDQGVPEGNVLRWEERWELPADSRVQLHAGMDSDPRITQEASLGRIRLEGQVDTVSPGFSDVVTAVEMGEELPPDPERPSLILRRAGGSTLWELAKSCGSTVSAIRMANDLDQEPSEDRLLLIPVS